MATNWLECELAISLGSLATRAGFKTRFVTANDLLLTMAAVQHRDDLANLMRRQVIRPRRVIVGEIGYLPLLREQAIRSFQIIAKRDKKGSLLLTSDLRFASGTKPSPAIPR